MVEELIASVSNISKIANIKAEQFSQISSQDMNNEVWLKLAKRVNALLRKRSVNGAWYGYFRRNSIFFKFGS